MNKSLVAIAAVVVFGGYFAATPYMAVSNIKDSIVEKDSEELSENIDFPVLRQNLKDQLNAKMMENMADELSNNPFAALGMGLASTMVDGMIDGFITPAGLAQSMQGKKARSSSTGNVNKDELFKDARFTYDSMSKFSAWVPNEDGEEIRFVLKRDGLNWKLVNMVLPDFSNSSSRPKAKNSSAKNELTCVQMKSIKNALDMYKLDNGEYPQNKYGLLALVSNPDESKYVSYAPAGYFYDAKVPKDPWRNHYNYNLLGDKPNITSDGPDGISGTSDDIVLSKCK